jgi:hypothetical protein
LRSLLSTAFARRLLTGRVTPQRVRSQRAAPSRWQSEPPSGPRPEIIDGEIER